MQKIIRYFKEWIAIKENLHLEERPLPLIKEGEVWWCSIGANVGHEIDGKNELFTRPVLIFKKLSHDTFWGVPGTGQFKKGSWFVEVLFQDRNQVFILAEIRSLSTKRLDKIMGTLSDDNFQKIKKAFLRLLIEN